MKPITPSDDDWINALWETAEFAVREAALLRGFLEYLRIAPDRQEEKQRKLSNWRSEVGLQFGNPDTSATADLFQRVRQEPPETRAHILRSGLAAAYSEYFGKSGKQ